MSGDPILVRSLLACYPAGWRRRYGEEFAALLSESMMAAPRSRRPVMLANVLRGALDARLNSKGVHMSERVRVPMATVVWAAGLFAVAGFGFQKITEYPDLKAAAAQHAAVGWSFNLLLGAAVVALIALVLALVPVTVALVRGRSVGVVKFLAVPLAAMAVWIGVLPLAYLLARDHGVHSAANIGAVAVVVVTGIGVVAATAWTATSILRRVPQYPLRRLRVATLTVVAGAMAAATIACTVWGIALRAGDPAEFNSDDGLLATSMSGSWIAITVIMAAATALAVLASRRELTAPAD